MFIRNYAAMIIDRFLIISDLHLGITKEFQKSGIFIPSQAKPMSDRINRLKRMTKTKELIILGDVKHNIPGVSGQEFGEIPEFFSKLKFNKITIIKGNHDGNIEKMIPKGIKVRKYVKIGKYFLTHGHMKMENEKMIIGHSHPFIRIKDNLGAVYFEPVWLHYLDRKEIIIMPAFNELCGATIINQDDLLGPIAKNLEKNKIHVYLLDGTYLGIAKEL
ncbi:MAG: metallophosphoesterase [Candidatus Aenigmatarchaeota archaeon]